MPSPRHAHVTFSLPEFESIEVQRERFKHANLAVRTVQSYDCDWRVFTAWCKAAGRVALPVSADTVELYCTDLIAKGRKVSTLERHCSAIQYAHRLAGVPGPCGAEVKRLLAGARRTLCQVPDQKEALSLKDLRVAVVAIDRKTPIGARNCAILLFGWATALRRSSLGALRLEDLAFDAGGIRLWVRNEKQDRKGEPRLITVPRGQHRLTCPVRAVERWLKFRGKRPGPLFCHVMRGHPNGKPLLGNRIAQLVQESAAATGLEARRYGAHSLRAGFVTEALSRGVNEIAIARHTGHRSLDTLRRYMRSRDPWRGNACAMVGL